MTTQGWLSVRSAAFTSALAFATVAFGLDIFCLDLGHALLLVGVGISLNLAAILLSRADPAVASQGQLRSTRFLVLFVVLLAVALFAKLETRMVHDIPRSDVYLVEQESAASLVRGLDPYGQTHVDPYYYDADFASDRGWAPENAHNGRLFVGYSYLPMSLITLIPGYALGDVRHALALAIIITAAIGLLLQPRWSILLLCAAFIFSPSTLRMLYMGWNEPVILMFCGLIMLGAMRNERWMPVVLGLMIALKQYNVVALPAAGLLLPRSTWRGYLTLIYKAAATAVIVTLPFVIWNWRAFVHDTISFHLATLRHDSISSGFDRPVPMTVMLLFVAIAAYWAVTHSRQHPAMFAASFALLLTVFVVLNKQVHPNYYFLISGLMMLTGCAAGCDAVACDESGTDRTRTGGESPPTVTEPAAVLQ